MSIEPDPPQTPRWWVKVGAAPYGPYGDASMERYVAEGRVRPDTLVAHDKDGPWIEAREVSALMAHLKSNRAMRVTPPGPAANAGSDTAANMFVHAEINSGAYPAFMGALSSLGLVVDLAQGAWLLRTRHGVGRVRGMLSQTLHMGDRFIVVDASRDRLAWYNLGPETDVRIKDVWNGDVPAGGPQL